MVSGFEVDRSTLFVDSSLASPPTLRRSELTFEPLPKTTPPQYYTGYRNKRVSGVCPQIVAAEPRQAPLDAAEHHRASPSSAEHRRALPIAAERQAPPSAAERRQAPTSVAEQPSAAARRQASPSATEHRQAPPSIARAPSAARYHALRKAYALSEKVESRCSPLVQSGYVRPTALHQWTPTLGHPARSLQGHSRPVLGGARRRSAALGCARLRSAALGCADFVRPRSLCNQKSPKAQVLKDNQKTAKKLYGSFQNSEAPI